MATNNTRFASTRLAERMKSISNFMAIKRSDGKYNLKLGSFHEHGVSMEALTELGYRVAAIGGKQHFFAKVVK